MQKPMPALMFKGMSIILKLRDIFRPRDDVLNELDIHQGFKVLDFGCGPGSYVFDTSKRVGKDGKIFALDIHPLAVKKVKDTALKMGLSNVETICSDCQTGLQNKEIDIVFLYDIFHMLSDKISVLLEIHRILKDNGILSFSDHHMKKKDILLTMEEIGLFKLSKHNKHTYSFIKRKK
ncbi:class I SAM-dependent methyltransferase [Desulfobacula sp.]|uniref:class I SAM-dependent methyltransferase n=1 Tax=Desulfobacula sp. TaxID=2593537 RepID=UPI00261961AF|nr:class I SAM-dependent methyltransferase [Desulfobacula sp.]